MFKKILIANRGAIAIRICRSLRKMNIQSVAVYAEDDAESLHISAADEAYCLGDGPVSNTYLNQERIFEIAQQCAADAIHPGYGFLSENSEFVERCEKRGLIFIGPRSRDMQAFALKHEARRIAGQQNVPLLPGSDLIVDLEEAKREAARISYPVMLKASAGGGGIGMQVCENEAALKQVFDSVRRLSRNNFSNDGIFIEKYIRHARHIEVQAFADGHGNAIALGERDCSTQRRNQKVIEETPAPNLKPETRAALQQHAVNLLAAVNYQNIATVEFVLDQDSGDIYFLEVNTRLQVEHGVTEAIYQIDLVQWMILQAAGELGDLQDLRQSLNAKGHSIQLRLYAEDPVKNFQPSGGLITSVQFPEMTNLRIDTWIAAGTQVSPQYDPLLAKMIIYAETRDQAIDELRNALTQVRLYGFESNVNYLHAVLGDHAFAEGKMTTRYLQGFDYQPATIDVISPGTMTTLQDYPGRTGYWHVGVPPSGPFDDYSFRLGNRLLGNPGEAIGLEITLSGPQLRFNAATRVVLTGAVFDASLNESAVAFYRILEIKAGDVLRIGKIQGQGARCYLCIEQGLDCDRYMGSSATFTLGEFGGHAGRSLRSGDVLRLKTAATAGQTLPDVPANMDTLCPSISAHWQIRVIYGPHAAPDFFTDEDMQQLFSAHWQVHYNSSRTGIRLVGPKPTWARSDGGEAGMHPSNIHDNAYAVGSVDYTGDMPVILGPDGPSLGGFVCPATVIRADRWKLGQLKAGNTIQFVPVSIDSALALYQKHQQTIAKLQTPKALEIPVSRSSPLVYQQVANEEFPGVTCRLSGDDYLLVELGEQRLDIELRFRVHELMLALQQQRIPGVLELTPGIRSLQLHYVPEQCALSDLLEILKSTISGIKQQKSTQVPSRIVKLPLSWDDHACRMAIERYMKSVRKDAPWCPSNLEFIRRINGLASIDEVKQIVFAARYLVMGLGDVYLGAPVATPVNPVHRLVTTKYNPARTWTAENSVGIGGAYLCVYGMEGPGGYQFVGRTLQMWNRYRQTPDFSLPWLLRFFDQIQFYPVSHQELQNLRREFLLGRHQLEIEECSFSLQAYQQLLEQQQETIEAFQQQRQSAFDQELKHWIESGEMNFDSGAEELAASELEHDLPLHCHSVDSPVAGSIWQLLVTEGQTVACGESLMILESMKMEIDVHAAEDGVVYRIRKREGAQVAAGESLIIIKEVE